MSTAENEARLKAIVDNVVDGIITIDEHRVVDTFNPAAERLFGYRANEVIGQNVNMLMPEPYHGEHDDYVNNYLTTGEAKIIGIGREVIGLRKDGSTFPLELAVSEMGVAGVRMFVGILRDISERKESEALIAEQNRRLLELSTPVLKVAEDVVLLPLIGGIDSERASQIIENLLNAIRDSGSRVAIIDITGVPMIDTYVADHIIKTIAAAEMLGAKVLVSGITPDVAQTIVKLGINTSAISACGPLQEGIAQALLMTRHAAERSFAGLYEGGRQEMNE